jgi:hypothetical protein
MDERWGMGDEGCESVQLLVVVGVVASSRGRGRGFVGARGVGCCISASPAPNLFLVLKAVPTAHPIPPSTPIDPFTHPPIHHAVPLHAQARSPSALQVIPVAAY